MTKGAGTETSHVMFAVTVVLVFFYFFFPDATSLTLLCTSHFSFGYRILTIIMSSRVTYTSYEIYLGRGAIRIGRMLLVFILSFLCDLRLRAYVKGENTLYYSVSEDGVGSPARKLVGGS